jgi:hypothetical protein
MWPKIRMEPGRIPVPVTLAARLTDGGKNKEEMFGFQNIFRGIVTALNGDLQVTGSASFKREQWKYHYDYLKYQIGYGPGGRPHRGR